MPGPRGRSVSGFYDKQGFRCGWSSGGSERGEDKGREMTGQITQGLRAQGRTVLLL